MDRLKIVFDGVTRMLDLDHITLRHAVAIQEFTGLTLLGWTEGLSVTGGVPAADFAADVSAAMRRTHMFADPAWITRMAAAHWLMLAQAGEDPPPLDDDYDCDVLGFTVAFLAAFTARVRAQLPPGKPDPTVPPGRPARSSRRTAPRQQPAATAPLPSTGS